MGFKARRTFKASGWIGKDERSIAEILQSSGMPLKHGSPAQNLLILDQDEICPGEKHRVTATVTIEIKEE